MIRRAKIEDIPEMERLLEQILAVHHALRPDLFRAQGRKYDAAQLEEIIGTPGLPVFVDVDRGRVTGYIMCREQLTCSATQLSVKTLYVDDLCVDERFRGKGIGKKLFESARDYARAGGFYNMTLHVWEGNPGGMAFYRAMGMAPQFTTMELIVNEPDKAASRGTGEDRITRMSEAYDRLRPLVTELSRKADELDALRPEVDKLRQYMDSGEWLEDYEADERGEVPPETNRSSLSQDGLYDLLSDIDSLRELFKTLAR